TYTSENPAIATVDAATGELKGVSVGTTRIIATSANSKKVTAACEVTVEPVPDKVRFATTVINLGVKDSLNIEDTGRGILEPAGTSAGLTYKIGNKKIATVNAATGVLTGVKTGSTTLRVTTQNGKTATIKVEVKSATKAIAL